MSFEFEHLLEVNEAGLSERLTRNALWFGLLCRAEDSRPFLPGLEKCEIVERGENYLIRILTFGKSIEIRDRVTYEQQQWIRFETEQTERHVGGSLTISIEEPKPEILFLRFIYRTTLDESGSDENGRYAEFIRSAYYQSDLDTLRVIRQMTISGNLQ